MRIVRLFPVLSIVFLTGCVADGMPTAAPGSGLPAQPAPVSVSSAEIRQAFVGRTAMFANGGEATYAPDGSYRFSGSVGASAGRYTITDGQICVEFPPPPGSSAGRSRCDAITKVGETYFLTDAQGRQFSIRFR